jgi:Na+-driven multidrug efflux pump
MPITRTGSNPLGAEPINKLLTRFAVPSIIAMLVSALYNIVDQFFIGRSVGTLGNAATNIAFPLTIICTALSLMCGIGGASNFNLSLGRKEEAEARRFAGNAVCMLFSFGLLLCIVVRIFLRPLMVLFGATSNIMDYSLTYTSITSLGFPFLILATGGSNLIRADGSPKFSMACTLTGAIVNTILDPLFIFGFNMGMAGAALATIIGQIISGIMVIIYLTRFKTVHLSLKSLIPSFRHWRDIIALGMAPCFNQLAMMIVQIAMNNILRHYGAQSNYGSEIPLACAGIITKVNMIFFSLCIGISQKYHRVREAYLKAAGAATIASCLAFLCFQLFPRQIIGLFGSGTAEYFHFAEEYFRIFLFFTFVNGLQPVSANFFTSIGKAGKGIFLSLTRQIIFLLPLIIILPMFMGIDGVMFSAPIADLMAAVLVIFFMRKELKELTVLEASEKIEAA